MHIALFYPWIKIIHISMVTTTACFFALRFFWMLKYPSLLQKHWVKRFPAIVDTTLLISGIAMALISHQYPIAQPWLTAKITALLAYIIFGSIALRGSSKPIRIFAGILALASISYIIAVAISRHPFPLHLILS
ncbi:hypothetical protein MNBD_GAMMA26-1293 [hydrothermal vent metagenome]|uniref:Regulator SirB n=1 Tax=hydrothermal vent metagenome TaxID=652676 RepID=A0A3B1B1W3_9ZZZZ